MSLNKKSIKFTSLVLVMILSFHFFAAMPNSQSEAAQGGIDEAIENLAQVTIQSFVLENANRSKTVAVWQITNDGDVDINTRDIRDLMDIELFNSGYDVSDRSKLDLIVSEQKLSMTGSVDESNLQQIGKIYGIDAFIYGRISRIDPGPPVTITFFVKAIDVETGKFIFAKRISGREVIEDREVAALEEKRQDEAPAPKQEEPEVKSARRSSRSFEEEFRRQRIEIIGNTRL